MMGMTRPPHPNMGQYPGSSQQQMMNSNSMQSYGANQQPGPGVQHPGFPPNSGSHSAASMQQQYSQQMMAGGAASRLSHFPQNSQSHGVPPQQYGQQYPGLAQSHPSQSPRLANPTPPPQPSRTPTSLYSQTSQGNYSPVMGGIIGPPQSNSSSAQLPYGGQNVPQPTYTSANSMPMTQSMPSNSGQGTYPGPGGSMMHQQQANRMPGHPNMDPMSNTMSNSAASNLQNQQQQAALNMEIQSLQQQINQLYNMQTPQTQQKMLDLQERARTLRAQLLMLQQRQQQQTGMGAAQQSSLLRAIAPKPQQTPLPGVSPGLPQGPQQGPHSQGPHTVGQPRPFPGPQQMSQHYPQQPQVPGMGHQQVGPMQGPRHMGPGQPGVPGGGVGPPQMPGMGPRHPGQMGPQAPQQPQMRPHVPPMEHQQQVPIPQVLFFSNLKYK
eukprot:GHVT01099198.1.p1 GENE.GHVT01099198.1~~GHVT01099198.1.p1  ORF type:complete len:450 (-),score=17.12 GHVT01099198.1:444-1754(-)